MRANFTYKVQISWQTRQPSRLFNWKIISRVNSISYWLYWVFECKSHNVFCLIICFENVNTRARISYTVHRGARFRGEIHPGVISIAAERERGSLCPFSQILFSLFGRCKERILADIYHGELSRRTFGKLPKTCDSMVEEKFSPGGKRVYNLIHSRGREKSKVRR